MNGYERISVPLILDRDSGIKCRVIFPAGNKLFQCELFALLSKECAWKGKRKDKNNILAHRCLRFPNDCVNVKLPDVCGVCAYLRVDLYFPARAIY